MKWHTEIRKVSELKEWTINPRIIDEDEYKELKESVDKLGNWDSLVINTDGTVIAGNQRLKIHKENGDEEVEVRVPERELTEEEIKEIGVKSNRHSGEWDFDRLADDFSLTLEEIGAGDLLYDVQDVTGSLDEGSFSSKFSETSEEFSVTFVFNTKYKDMMERFIGEKGKKEVVDIIVNSIKDYYGE